MGTNIELSDGDKRDIQADHKARMVNNKREELYDDESARRRAKRMASAVGVSTPTAGVLRRRSNGLCIHCANNGQDCMTCGWDKSATQRTNAPGLCEGCLSELPKGSLNTRCEHCD